MNEEYKREIEEELRQEERDEAYSNWVSDNEERLKESFVMTFDNRSLREWILEDENRFKDFVETFYNSWEAHLSDELRLEE